MPTDYQNNAYVRSRIATILSLVQSIERTPSLSLDVVEFASSAVHQLKLLDKHIENLQDPADFNKRRGDRGYQAATLPHAQTVEIGDPLVNEPTPPLTFK